MLFATTRLGWLGLLCPCSLALANPTVPPPAAENTADIAAAGWDDALRRDFPAVAAESARLRAEAGEADAQFVLGLLHDLGAGVRLDHDLARRWLEQAADHGQAFASRYLFWKYTTGFGVPSPNSAQAQA